MRRLMWKIWRSPEAVNMKVILGNRGLCAGVDRAIRSSNGAAPDGAPICAPQVVHNKYVVDDLRAKGAIFVEALKKSLSAVPWYSARSVSRAVRQESKQRVGRFRCDLSTGYKVRGGDPLA
jgi:4-hydroxy-3-methylbut-2-enyl diphosphate reductase